MSPLPGPNKPPTGRMDIRQKIALDGKQWDVGVFYVQGDKTMIKVAAAREAGGTPVLFWPTSLAKDGKVESFELQGIDRGRRSLIQPDALPAPVLEQVQNLADKERLHAVAADFSLSRNDGGRFQQSHIIQVDGQKAVVQIAHYQDGKLASLNVADPDNDQHTLYQLNVQEVDLGGHISKAVLQEFSGGWKAVPEDTLSPRLKEELYRFANQHKLFGAAQKGYETKLEEHAADIIAESDIDREAAKLFHDHFEAKVNEALDKRDPKAFAAAVAEERSHRDALGYLSKPKNHFARQEFEAEAATRTDLEHPSRVKLLLEERARKAGQQNDTPSGPSR